MASTPSPTTADSPTTEYGWEYAYFNASASDPERYLLATWSTLSAILCISGNTLVFIASTKYRAIKLDKIMKIGKKLDSGKIIHQIRPEFIFNDDIHTIGNKIIKKTAIDLCKILTKKKKIKFYKIKTKYKTKVYKKKILAKKA